MKGCNSRAKGAQGEREASSMLSELFGWNSARRSQQYCGTESSADLVVEETPDLHYEVKRVQRLAVPKTMQRAREEAGRKCPVLLHRPNHGEWLLTIFVEDLPRLCHAYDSALQEDKVSQAMAEKTLPAQDADPRHGGGEPPRVPRHLLARRRKGAHQNQEGGSGLHGGSATGGVRPCSEGGVPNPQP